MRDLLVILNPRQIKECISALADLQIDKLWIRNMSEIEIAEAWPKVLDMAMHHDRLILISDDAVVRPHALEAVQRLLDEAYPVVTGYSNLSSTDFRVNLCKSPLGPAPTVDAYDLFTLNDILESEFPAIKTWFTGMCLTGMSLAMWEQFPFQVTVNGGQSDFTLCKRLEARQIPIVAAREAFVWHVKEVWNRIDVEPRKRLLLDEVSALVMELQELQEAA
jgi:hypothetical protein